MAIPGVRDRSPTGHQDRPTRVLANARILGPPDSKALGRSFEGDLTVTEFEPDHKLAWVTDKPMKVATTFTFKPVDGGTRVDQSIDGEIDGFFKLAQPVAQPMMKRQVQHDLETFRDLMDAKAL